MAMGTEKIEGKKMKVGDFRPCARCGKGMMHTGLPLFYRVTIQRMAIDMREVHRADGMEKFFAGHVGIARVFHDPDIGIPFAESVTVLVCETCANQPPTLLALLLEQAAKQAEQRAAKAKAEAAE